MSLKGFSDVNALEPFFVGYAFGAQISRHIYATMEGWAFGLCLRFLKFSISALTSRTGAE